VIVVHDGDPVFETPHISEFPTGMHRGAFSKSFRQRSFTLAITAKRRVNPGAEVRTDLPAHGETSVVVAVVVQAQVQEGRSYAPVHDLSGSAGCHTLVLTVSQA
jgi:hypothetical protein